MRVPLSWLRELVELPAQVTGREVAERLIRRGLEVETVHEVGSTLTGPLVIGRVLSFVEEEHSNGKTIRWCQVDVGPDLNVVNEADQPAGRGIVCGARNFENGDSVVVALPGAVLPGPFAITARKTYGHVSDGMICSARELGTGEDHTGIWVLPDDAAGPGQDAIAALGLRDEVLEIDVTPDRGYCLSMRGIGREVATAFGLSYFDPAVNTGAHTPSGSMPPPSQTNASADQEADWPVQVDDPVACDRFVTMSVTNLHAARRSPLWLQRRLQLSGMRSISLAVDITNYVMLELGQPLHAYDRAALSGTIVVRHARPGEQLETLDGTKRQLDPADLLICDDSGAIGVAGVMGGAATEINASSTDILIEAAHFDADLISQSARRHRLPSEASRRFARGVDNRLQEVAAERAVRLLSELGAADRSAGRTMIDHTSSTSPIDFDPSLASRLVGLAYSNEEVTGALAAVGCQVSQVGPNEQQVVPPPWRPDLVLPADLVEEIARVRGYDAIPSILPKAPAGSGLTHSQRLRRRMGMALAGSGFVEVQTSPFLSPRVHDQFGLSPDDDRRNALRVANPLSDEEPELRTSLLPGLLATLRRNVGRGFDDVALFETGLVFRPAAAPHKGDPPRPATDRRPSVDEIAELDALLPRQPRRVAAVMAGRREPAGWWGSGRAADWTDAINAAHIVARAAGVEIKATNDQHAPWHPGRCAALNVAGELVGHAGELHPRVVAEMQLPPRTCAMELEFSLLERQPAGLVSAPDISTFPVAKEDVSLVVDADIPAREVLDALRDGAGQLIESVDLFDVYSGEQVGNGKRSLAFSLRFRAPDRTLAAAEVAGARDAAVAEANRRTGAVPRS